MQYQFAFNNNTTTTNNNDSFSVSLASAAAAVVSSILMPAGAANNIDGSSSTYDHSHPQQASNSEFYLAHHHQHQHNNIHINNEAAKAAESTSALFNVHEIWAISIATICFVVGFPSNLISIIVCLRSLVRKPVLTRQRFLVQQKNGAYNNHYRGVFRAAHLRKQDNNNNNNNNNSYGMDAPNVTVSLFSPDDVNNNNPNNNNNNNNNNMNQNGIDRYHQFNNNNNNNNGYVTSGSRFKSGSIGSTIRGGSGRSARGFGGGGGSGRGGLIGRRSGGARCRLLINLHLKHNNQKRKDSTKSLPPFNHNNNGGFSAIKLTRNPHRHCFELYLIEICFCDIFIVSYFFLECMLLVLTRLHLIDPMYAEPVLVSKFMCQFIIGFNRTITLMHNWLVSSLAITRCYAIYKPLNSHANFGQKFYLRLNMFVLVTLSVVFSTLNFLGVMPLEYKRIHRNDTAPATTIMEGSNSSSSANEHIHMPYAQCGIGEKWYNQYEHIEVYINLTLGIIGYSLPCIITLIINLILIYNIRHINMFRSPINKNNNQPSTPTLPHGGSLNANLNSCGGMAIAGSNLINSSGSSKQHMKSRNQFVKTTSSLLTLSFSYLICYLPYSFLFFLVSLGVVSHLNGDLVLAFTCLKYLNHTLNFFIYFATGKRFRGEVIAFLGFRNKENK